MIDWQISPLEDDLTSEVQAKIDTKTKPLGSLGRLERLALQLAKIKRSDKIDISKPAILVFAADHGIAEHGISIAGSDVTQLMVSNFLQGGAAINCFCRVNDIALTIIDAGMKNRCEISSPMLVDCRVGEGTRDFSSVPAMTEGDVWQCLKYGKEVAEQHISSGYNILGFGEMGIGNTSAASAILSAMTSIKVEQCVGRGTGISSEQLTLKKRLVQQGVERIKRDEPFHVMSEVGGFEIVQICGAMLTAASKRVPIVVDGFIVTAAAVLAKAINSHVTDYMVFAHNSDEPGHELMLNHLAADPLIELSLRLGEGTGAALAMPIIQCAASFYNDMASFEQANIEVET